jgi:hypothetical protein
MSDRKMMNRGLKYVSRTLVVSPLTVDLQEVYAL